MNRPYWPNAAFRRRASLIPGSQSRCETAAQSQSYYRRDTRWFARSAARAGMADLPSVYDGTNLGTQHRCGPPGMGWQLGGDGLGLHHDLLQKSVTSARQTSMPPPP
jgi:hypothetical protein